MGALPRNREPAISVYVIQFAMANWFHGTSQLWCILNAFWNVSGLLDKLKGIGIFWKGCCSWSNYHTFLQGDSLSLQAFFTVFFRLFIDWMWLWPLGTSQYLSQNSPIKAKTQDHILRIFLRFSVFQNSNYGSITSAVFVSIIKQNFNNHDLMC